MAREIDEKVVEMQFDNKNFEKNVSQSMSTLDKLKASLKMEGATQGFENLDKAASSVSFDKMADSLEALQKRFSTFGIVGMRVIENVTDSVMNLASKTTGFITNSIKSGGIKRAMNLENANFQLQGLLKDEAAVEAVMQNVKDSVDGTAYSLDAAAKVASQLAASGMRAGDEMFSALRGAAGVAAMTNSEYEDIGRIYTQVAGQGRLMGDQLLQLSSRGMNAAATLAEYLGSTEAEVRSMVSKGEIDFATFAAAMDDAFGEHAKKANETLTGAFSNVKSALARIGEIFVSPLIVQNGPLVELLNTIRVKINDIKSELGPIADLFTTTVNKAATGLSKFISGLDVAAPFEKFEALGDVEDKLSGTALIIESLQNVVQGLAKALKPIGSAWKDVFSPITSDTLYSVIERLHDFSSKLVISDKSAENLRSTFKGLFSVLSIVGNALTSLLKFVSPITSIFAELGSKVLTVTGRIGEWIAELNNSVKKNDIFNKSVQTIIDRLGEANSQIRNFAATNPIVVKIRNSLSELLASLRQNIKAPSLEILHNLLGRIQARLSQLGDSVSKVTDIFRNFVKSVSGSSVVSVLSKLFSGLQTLSKGILSGLGSLLSGIASTLADINFSGIVDLISGISLSGLAYSLKNFMNSMSGSVRSLGGFGTKIERVLDETRNSLRAYQETLKADVLLKIAGAVGILAASLVAISLIDSDKLAASLGAITVVFADLIGSMSIITKQKGKLNGIGITMIELSGAILILSLALKQLGSLNMSELIRGLSGIIVLMASLTETVKHMDFDSKGLFKKASSMVIVAAAIKILVSVCSDLAKLSWSELGVGITGLLGVTVILAGLCKSLSSNTGNYIKGSSQLMLVGVALKILASVCSELAQLNWTELARGIVGVASISAILALLSKSLKSDGTSIVKGAGQMLIASAALLVMTQAVKQLSGLGWEELGKGLLGIAGSMAVLVIGLDALKSSSKGAGSFLVAAAALLVMTHSVKELGSIDTESLVKSITALAATMTILAVGLNAMKNTLKGSAALLVASAALLVLTPTLSILGAMSWEAIAKGLVALAGAFTVFGVAGAVLSSLTPSLLALSGAIALFGVGILAFGAGLLTAGVGLTALAVGFTALVGALTSGQTAVSTALVIIINAIADMIPTVLKKIGEGIVTFCKVIADSATAIAEATKTVVLALVDTLVECVPAIADGILILIDELLKSLVQYTPSIVNSLLDFVVGVLLAVGEALSRVDVSSLLIGIVGIGLMSGLVALLSAIGPMIPGAMIAILGVGALIAEVAVVLAAIGALGKIPGFNELLVGGGIILENIGVAIGKFIGGLVGGIASGFTSQLPTIGSDLSNFMENLKPFIEGASSIDSSLLDGIGNLTSAIIMISAAEFIEGLASWFTGGQSLSKFGSQLADFGTAICEFSEAVDGNVNVSAIKNTAEAGKALSELNSTLQRSGGIFQIWTGEKSLGTFAANIKSFGEAMSDYSLAVSGNIDLISITQSVMAGSMLASLTDQLELNGGLIQYWIGEKSLSDFGKNIKSFGKAIVVYSNTVSENLDVSSIRSSVSAGKALAELTNSLDRTGGLFQWWTGEKSLGQFAVNVRLFGRGIADYSRAIGENFDADNIIMSVEAGKALSELTDSLDRSGGIVQWWTGEKNLSSFGSNIISFGRAISEYSLVMKDELNIDNISASVEVGKLLSELTSSLEATGGVVQWWTGEKDLGSFSENIKLFGTAMSEYSRSLEGGLNVTSMKNSVTIGKSLAELTSSLDTTGGVIQWWTGEKDLGGFATNISAFGSAISEYSRSLDDGLNIAEMMNSVVVGRLLSGLTSSLDATGGVIQWWTGEKNLGSFAENIKLFGSAISKYSRSLDGGLNITSMKNSVTVGKSLAELTSALQATGGVVQWWTGEKNLGSFAENIELFGSAISGYSKSIGTSFNTESVTASVEAGKLLVELTNLLDDSGGIIQWWTGDKDLGSFSENIKLFGSAIGEYSKSIGNEIDSETITASVEAGKLLSELTSALQATGGVVQWWTGQSDLGDFSQQIVSYATAITEFSNALSGNISFYKIRLSAEAGTKLAELSNLLPSDDLSNLTVFGKSVLDFSVYLSSFMDEISGLDFDELSASLEQLECVVEFAKSLDGFEEESIKAFGDSLGDIGKSGISKFIKAFAEAESDVKSTASKLAEYASAALKISVDDFKTIGINAAQGFINGMNSMKTSVYSTGWNIGQAALTAAKIALGIHSPSKEFKYLGEHVGAGFKIGLNNSIGPTVKTTSEMMNKAIAAAKSGVDAFESWAEERKFYGELSTQEELAGWRQLQKMYKEGTDERKKIDQQIYTYEQQIVKDTFEYSKNWLENEEYYDRLTTAKKLAGWKRIQARYMAGTDERKEADREVYSLEKQLEDERYQEKLDHIDNEVFYGRMSKQQELVELKNIQDQYEVNSEKWLEVDKKIYSKREEVVQEFYDNITKYIDNEKSYNRMGDLGELGTLVSYMSSFEKGSDQWKEIMNSAYDLVITIGEAQIQYEKDIADAEEEHAQKKLELEEEYADKVKEVNQQLEDDIESLNQQYEDSVQSRADSLYKSYGLFDEVSKKDEVSGESLTKNLNDQVAEFKEWQGLMQSLSERGINDDMMEELEEMGPSAIANIRALSSMTDTELAGYVDLWAEKHRLAREQATDELEDLRSETDEKIGQLKVDAANDLEEYKKVWQESMDELDESLKESLESITTDFHKEIGLISKYTEEEFGKMAESVGKLLSEKGYAIGANTIAGIIQGFEESKPQLASSVASIGSSVISGVSNMLEIHSPSRVMYKLGVYTIQGLLNAFDGMSSTIFETGGNTAENVTDGFVDTLASISAVLDDEMEFEPTIRPVVDLSNLTESVRTAQSAYGDIRHSMTLASQMQTSVSGNRMTVSVDNDDVVNAIKELREDMSYMSEAMSRMQVIMDTGALVGSLIDPIDNKLGQRQIYKRRGN